MRRAAATLLLLAACGSPPDPATVTVAEAPPGAPGEIPAAGPTRPRPARTAVVAAPDPPRGPGPLGPFVPPATTLSQPGLAPALAATDAEAESLRKALEAKVAAEGGGTALDVGPVAGRFRAGEVLEISVTLTPGRCYSALAVSSGQITDLALSVVMMPPPPLPPTVLMTSTTAGPHPALGASGCFKNPVPLPLRAVLRIEARQGGGLAAAQVLVR